MKIIRSYQTTVIGETTSENQSLMDGPNNSQHGGLMIPANAIARGDYLRARALVSISQGDGSESNFFILGFSIDGQELIGFTMNPWNEVESAMYVDFAMVLSNSGFLWNMSKNVASGSSNSLSFGGVSAPKASNALALDIQSAVIPSVNATFNSGNVLFPVGVTHSMTLTGNFDLAGGASGTGTARLEAFQFEISQPLNGNTAGQ